MHGEVVLTLNTVENRRLAWLADRRTCITGTEVAAILGLSKFASPMTVYLDKKGLLEIPENDAMRWGRRLERPILEAYADATGMMIELADPFQVIKAPGFNLLGATLDARRADGPPVDAKNIRQRSDEWGEDGSDTVPPYYAAQLMAQIAVTGMPYADLAVLFSGQEFATFRIHRDLEAEGLIKEKIAVWWERHIVQDVPPEVDGSKATSEWLTRRFSKSTQAMIRPSEDLLAAHMALKKQKELVKEALEEKDRLENILKQAMGEAEGIMGLCTWKNNKESPFTDWEKLANELLCAYPRDARNEFIQAFTTTKPGARVLRLK